MQPVRLSKVATWLIWALVGPPLAACGRRRKLDLTRLHSSDFDECERSRCLATSRAEAYPQREREIDSLYRQGL